MSIPETSPWRLIVPVKARATAKSRLDPPSGVSRPDLAHAFALDTLTAVCRCLPARQVTVVTSDRATASWVRQRGATVVPDPGAGLNPAVEAGIRRVRASLGDGPTAVLLGDLPTLTPHALAVALSACTEHPCAFVPDAAGTGTVLLAARSCTGLVPRFGPDSAAEHARTGVRLDLALPQLRTDVDDDAALRTALSLGLGSCTAAVLAAPARLA